MVGGDVWVELPHQGGQAKGVGVDDEVVLVVDENEEVGETREGNKHLSVGIVWVDFCVNGKAVGAPIVGRCEILRY